MKNEKLFLACEPFFYRNTYIDISDKTDDELFLHYQNIGEKEGRIASPFAVRDGLLSIICSDDSVLEIGPFACPLIHGGNVKYFDVLDQKALTEHALKIGYSPAMIPEIDYVSDNGDLSIVDDKRFDFVLSCHCIEHQPDLIEHLNQVSRILKPGGFYLLLIPDKRYCFDYYLAESTIASVVQAHFERRTSHSLESLINQRLFTTHNVSKRHWLGDHGEGPCLSDLDAIEQVLQEYKVAGGSYIDVHAWQFTPRSFLSVVHQLHGSQLITLQPKHVFGTPFNSNTFCAALCNG